MQDPHDRRQAMSAPRTSDAPSLAMLLALHFVPGVLIFGAYTLSAEHLVARGIPRGLTLHLAFAFVGIPACFILLWRLSLRETGRASVMGVVRYRRPLRVWIYIVLVPLFFVFAGVASTSMSPVSDWLQDHITSALPGWILDDAAETAVIAVSPWLVFAVRVIVDGVANPIAEELYFRGYLLPRLEGLGHASPAIHGLLFALAHLWQPQNVPLIALLVIPLYYAVRYFKSVRLAIVIHCAANLLGAFLAMP